MSSNLMDTAPGGENTQYESIKTVTEPTSKQAGQLGEPASSATSELDPAQAERGEKTAENARYGQAISESGFGGKTTESEGVANQGGFGGAEAQEGEGELASSRREQGYGPGSNVGA